MHELEGIFVNENNIDLLWKELQSDQLKHDFYKQILFIIDKRWNGQKVDEIEFSESYPRFSVINKRQFEFYLYYRTQMLELMTSFLIPHLKWGNWQSRSVT